MRAGSTRPGRQQWRWTALVALLALIVCAAATGVAWAAGSQSSPSGSPAASPATSQSSGALGDPAPSPTPTTVAFTVTPAAVL